MATAVGKLYGKAVMHALSKRIDWMNDSIKVALCTAAYAPDQDAHEYFDQHITGEVVGEGYTAGGQALINRTMTYDPVDNRTTLDADDARWPESTFSCLYAVIYDDTPATNKPLIGYIQFDEEKHPSKGTFLLEFNELGICRFQVA